MSSLFYLFTFYITRVDQDFDQSRVPSLLEKLMPLGRPKKITPDREAALVSREDCSSSVVVPTASLTTTTSSTTSITTRPSPSTPSHTAEIGPGGRNRAVVDSDSENDRSDTSIESDGEREGEESQNRSRKKKLPPRKRRKTKK